jgi:hypothetical protein
MNTIQKIALGTQVHCILYGGRDGTVVAIHGEAQPEKIINFPGLGLSTGGNAEYDIIWDDMSRSPRIPECIIRGVQWRVLDLPRATDERIIELQELAAQKQASDLKAEQERKAAMEEAREKLIAWHPELEVNRGAKTAARNIRIQLKQSFAWVKFSVRSDHNSIRVNWTDGPTVAQIEEITNPYREGRFDGMSDSYQYNQDRVWPFGGAEYISADRNISDETREDTIRIIAENYHESCDLEHERYRALRRTTIPAGHRLTGVQDGVFTTAKP